MIYIFAQQSGVERILAYKTHFEASAILIKEKRNTTFDKDWKIVESFLIPLHLLKLFNAKVTVDLAKATMSDDFCRVEDDNQSCCAFGLARPPPVSYTHLTLPTIRLV